MKRVFLIFLLSFFLISLAGFVFAEENKGLVPCGNPGQKLCTICDFFVLASNIINFILFTIVPPLAILLLSVGGFMYMIAYMAPGQGPGLITRAKSAYYQSKERPCFHSHRISHNLRRVYNCRHIFIAYRIG